MTENIQEKIENKIIDCINAGVSGRLIIFKPEKRGMEDYLAVGRRGKYKEKEIYLQINSLVIPSSDKSFTKDFLQESFKASQNYYLLFVCFDEISQSLSEYLWLVPSLGFKDTAKTIKSSENKNLFRFQAPLDVRNKSQYSKFVIKTIELGKIILNALENGGKFDLRDIDSDGEKAVNLGGLKEFLCNARRSTYASNASPIDNPRLLASKQIEFQKGDYYYRDVSFNGEKKFIGQEIVYQNAKPIWGMNYIGSSIGKLETVFLKEALFRLSEECRLGEGGPKGYPGSCEYEKRELKYQDRSQGSLENFYGTEEIFSKGKSTYKLDYQGGLI